MGRMVRKGCLQEVGLELCFGECRGFMEWITLVNAWNWEKTWFVQGLGGSGADRDAGKPQQHLHIWWLG